MRYYNESTCIALWVNTTRMAEAGQELWRSSRTTQSRLSSWALSISMDGDPTTAPVTYPRNTPPSQRKIKTCILHI